MKTKIICSALLGLTICGSAFAISADDRKAFCDNADGFVWVGKTQACIPVNPCKSTTKDIQHAYCTLDTLYRVDDMEKLVSRLMSVRGWVNGSILDIKKIEEDEDREYYAAKTTDQDYQVMEIEVLPKDDIYGPMVNAFKVYNILEGYTIRHESEEIDGVLYSMVRSGGLGLEESTCRDAADFASLIGGKWVQYSFTTQREDYSSCKLMVRASDK